MRAADTRRAFREAVKLLRGVDVPRLQQALVRNTGGYPSSWGSAAVNAGRPADPTTEKAGCVDPARRDLGELDDAVRRLWAAAGDLAQLRERWSDEMTRVTPCGNEFGCPDGNMAHVGRRVDGVPVCEACSRFWRRGGGWRRLRAAS